MKRVELKIAYDKWKLACAAMARLLLVFALLLTNWMMDTAPAGAGPLPSVDSLAGGRATAGAYSDATSSWSGFQPAGWSTIPDPACSVMVFDSLGLQDETAQYQYSWNSGATWTDWSNAGLTVTGDISTTKTLRVSSVPFIESATANRIRFRIMDTDGQFDTSPSYTVMVDSIAPSEPLTPTVSPAGWSNSASFTVSWTNPADVSGIAAAFYKLDGPPTLPMDGILVTGSDIHIIPNIVVGSEGEHTVYVWLRDVAGNVDHTRHISRTLRYDISPPAHPTSFNSSSHSPATWSNNNVVSVQWTAALDNLSGVAGYALLWDQNPNTLPLAITTTVGLTGTSPALPDGNNHYAHLRSRDNAGNWTATALHLGPFYIDRQSPNAPIGLTATPITWTNTNLFSLNWSNPADLSGVAGAYYKLDTPPTSASDGVWVAGDNRTSLTNISVTGDGAHPIYVWLQDRAGNVDHTRYASTTLYYKAAPPGAPTDLTVTPSEWTNTNSFSVSWVNPPELTEIVGAYYKLDGIPTLPVDGIFVPGDNIHSISGISVAGAGEHVIYVWLKDSAGNVDHTRRAAGILRYDNIPPTLPTVFTSTTHLIATWSPTNTVAVQWSGATDSLSGIGGYALLWDQSPTTLPSPFTTTLGITGTSPALADGVSHFAHLRTRDAAGNWTAGALHLGPFFIDRQPPAAPISLTATPITWTNVNQFNLSWINPIDLSGVAGAYYKLDAPPFSNQDGVWMAGEGRNSLSNLSVSNDGAHPVHVWLKDLAGNASIANRASTTLYLDTTPPGPPSFLEPNPSGWSNTSSFSISWTNPSLELSGVAGAYWKLDLPPTSNTDGTFVESPNQIVGISISEDGTHPIYVWLKDRAGNVDYRTRNSDVFRYDGTRPTTTHQMTGTWGLNNWFISPVTMSLSAQDNLSGVQKTEWRVNAGSWQQGTFFSLGASGVYTVEYRSTDVAGNVELPRSQLVKIDQQSPATTLTKSGALGNNGWYTSPVQISLTPADAHSGIAATRYRVSGEPWQTGVSLTLNIDGVHQVEYYSEDNAGNRETTRAEVIRVDITPPTTSHIASGVLGDGNWFRSGVSITLNASDLTSGPAFTFYRVDGGAWTPGTEFFVTGEAMHRIDFYSVDNAGNIEPLHTLEINIDATPPLPPINLASDPYRRWTSTNAFTITWTALPDLSGIAGAYYKLQGEPTFNTDGIYAPGAANQITGLSVPGEGKHSFFVWLRDRAGNVNYLTRNGQYEALWYDATPPNSTHTTSGQLGQNGWYTSPVRVNIVSQDALSGVGRTFYRVGTGSWAEGTVFLLNTSDRHTVQYYAVDVAGNTEAAKSAFVRVDLDAPAAPIGLRTGPTGWQRTNSFSALWNDPADTSGIIAAYYRLNSPPTSATDGILVVGPQEKIEGIQVPAEGKHTLYVWLQDAAGNIDHTRAASVIDTLWYDPRPPTTTHTITGTPGIGGWYRSAVTVNLNATDAGSGIAGTYYRLNSGAWVAGNTISLPNSGVFLLEYYSIDQAGNAETPHAVTIRIDIVAPTSRVTGPSGYQKDDIITVTWSGSDQDPGSGILYYDIEYREGSAGAWTAWRTATDETSGVFVGQRGRVYYFRSRARDRAGNMEEFPGAGDIRFYIEPVANGDFERRDFSLWTAGGVLGKQVTQIDAPGGGRSYGAILGNPELGPCYNTQPPVLLEGFAVISQTVRVPAAEDVVAPKLYFWYHIVTYDVVWSNLYQRLYDSFDVEVTTSNNPTPTLLLRDGNYDPSKVGEGKPPTDLGWKRAAIDLSAYAGQVVTLYFRNSNRVDRYFNTWTYLDDISIVGSDPLNRTFLPHVVRRIEGRAIGMQDVQSRPPAADYGGAPPR